MDDRLRTLERAARADPTDAEAAWALVRALDQAGDAIGAWRERCRLARGGDEAARVELELPIGLRNGGAATWRALLQEPYGVSVSQDTIALSFEDALVVLDARTLELRWNDEPVGDVAVHGPFVLHVRSGVLAVRDARDGTWVCRATMPRGIAKAPSVSRGHVFVVVRDLLDEFATSKTLDLAAALDSPLSPTATMDLTDLLVESSGEHSSASDPRVLCVRTCIAVTHREQGEIRLCTVRAEDRASGEMLWTRTFESPQWAEQFEGAVATDVVYIVREPREDQAKQGVTVLAMDARTGADLWSREVTLDLPAEHRVTVHAARAALIVVAFGGGNTQVVRWGEAA